MASGDQVDDMNVIKHYYLGDPEALKAKMEAVANQGKKNKQMVE